MHIKDGVMSGTPSGVEFGTDICVINGMSQYGQIEPDMLNNARASAKRDPT